MMEGFERDKMPAGAESKYLKQRAHYLVKKAVREGVLVPASACSRCGEVTKTFGHHANYFKPLEVEWLCNSCHVSETWKYRRRAEPKPEKKVAEIEPVKVNITVVPAKTAPKVLQPEELFSYDELQQLEKLAEIKVDDSVIWPDEI